MAVERISNFKIESRSLFSAIYGISSTPEYFIDKDLHTYSLWQQLFLYLKEQGYIVVFYNRNHNFFSYEEIQLIKFFGLKNNGWEDREKLNNRDKKKYIAPINSPFARSRRNLVNEDKKQSPVNSPIPNYRTENDMDSYLQSNYPQIQVMRNPEQDGFYFITATERVFQRIFDFATTNVTQKLAVIFTTPLYDEFPDQKDILSQLTNLMETYEKSNIKLKLIALYNYKTTERFIKDFDEKDDLLFYDSFFHNILFGEYNHNENQDTGKIANNSNLYYLPSPGKDEIENFLNRKRLLESVNNIFAPVSFDHIALRLWQSNRLISDLGKNTKKEIEMEISKIDSEKAIDKLNRLSGIDTIKAQFNSYLTDLRRSRISKKGPRFRPHMAFLGNPGTGKTTIARIFADILREEGLLEKGHLVPATVGDLIGEYVGSTRPKTQALCEKARGGVLFIDEAYGLYKGKANEGQYDYGSEAIEVLIQFMENNDDSLVIIAGYENQIMELIRNGNQGFTRRFNGAKSMFHFEDYQPEVLYSIAMKQLDMPTTVEFNKALLKIITYLFVKRNTLTWGNAGEMENLASNIDSAYRESGSTGPLDIEHIPADLMRYIDPNLSQSTEEILQELNDMIGLQSVKAALISLFESVKASRVASEIFNEFNQDIPPLNFVFSGNPGTGKTTVARLIGKILHSFGILPSAEVKEYKKADIVSNQVGQTPVRVNNMFDDCIGKVLFIDEAYTLADQYGKEAIDQIVGNLTDKKYEGKLALIIAGYPNDINALMKMNPGMPRRFGYNILFDDYSNEELWQIFLLKVKQIHRILDEEACKPLAIQWFNSLIRDIHFANAGACDQLLKIVKSHYAKRLISRQNPDKEYARRFLPEDFPAFEEEDSHFEKEQEAEQVNQLNNKKQLAIDCSDENRNYVVKEITDFDKAVGIIQGNNGLGTAFIFSLKGRYILTASHVVENDSNFSFLMNAGVFFTQAHLLWNDPAIDMAILQIDELPKESRYFSLDNKIDNAPTLLEIVLHCGFPFGSAVSKNLSTYDGTISNYEKGKEVENRHFDAILSTVNATHGCSGGPVFRKNDMTVIGLLQGGFTEAGTRIITDIHQLFNNKSIQIKF